MPDVYEHAHVVRDDEIDALGRASNVAYVQWMLDAALAHTAAQGWPAEAYERLGSGWVVRSHAIEYRRPALPGDRVVVRTWVATMDAATSLRRYRIERTGDGALLATAETRWAFINFATGRPARIPPDIAGAFAIVNAPAQ
ncbi:MAG TPA: acyl-CoA thioesterase [Planctomycetes bacterium]|nr:acyl-CoA thioesterase [Planctomycetota bacterium]